MGFSSSEWATSRLAQQLSLSNDRAEQLGTEVAWFLRAAAAADHPLTPSRAVDRAWHVLLKEPKGYAAFSKEQCGSIVVHDSGGSTPGQYVEARNAVAQLRGELLDEFWPAEPAAAAADCGSRTEKRDKEEEDGG